jgi:hypothetical protein
VFLKFLLWRVGRRQPHPDHLHAKKGSARLLEIIIKNEEKFKPLRVLSEVEFKLKLAAK